MTSIHKGEELPFVVVLNINKSDILLIMSLENLCESHHQE